MTFCWAKASTATPVEGQGRVSGAAGRGPPAGAGGRTVGSPPPWRVVTPSPSYGSAYRSLARTAAA